jgi:hypothetical protein
LSEPEIVIVFPLEGQPTVRLVAMRESEQQRLLDWINYARPEYGDLVARALELARRECAA